MQTLQGQCTRLQFGTFLRNGKKCVPIAPISMTGIAPNFPGVLERPRAKRSAAAASLCAVMASDATLARLETVPEVCSTFAASFLAAAASASEHSSAFDPRFEPPTFGRSR